MNKALYQRAIEEQEEFKYTCLVNTTEIEAWRCKKDNTSIYCFDIVITRFGIAVFGDIDTITFRVGSSYGVDFLAGDDVDYYILSKVEQNCKNMDFDKNYFLEVCQDYIIDIIEDNPRLFLNEDEEFPEFLSKDPTNWQKIKNFLIKTYENSIDPTVRSLNCFIDDIESVSYVEEAYQILDSYYSLLPIIFRDYNFNKISESTMFLLYMINHAAKQIKKIKENIND